MGRSTNRSGRRTAGARLAFTLSLAPFGAASAAWDAVSNLNMGFEANDNPRLGQTETGQPQTLVDARDHTSLRAFMDARFRLSDFGPRGDVVLQPRIRGDTYSDPADEDLQRKDAYLYSRARYHWQRAQIGFRGDFSRESILSSELLDATPIDLGTGDTVGQPIDTGTGQLVLLNEHRNRVILTPSANFSISPRTGIGFDATYLDLSYSGAQFRGRSDIDQTEFGTSITRTIDDRTGASARVFGSDFHAKVTDNETRTVGVEGSIQRKVNSIWAFNLKTGVERSAYTFIAADGATIDNASANFTLGFGLDKHTDVATLTFDLTRQLDPSATGFMTEHNELRVLYRREVSQRLTTSVAVRAFRLHDLSQSEEVYGRTFARAEFAIEWAFTPTWSLNAAYDAISQNFAGSLRQDGNANIVSFGVVYRGLSRRNGN